MWKAMRGRLKALRRRMRTDGGMTTKRIAALVVSRTACVALLPCPLFP